MKIFTKINNELERQINKDLLDIEKWLNNWRLRMAKKEELNLELYDKIISQDNNPTFLGIYLKCCHIHLGRLINSHCFSCKIFSKIPYRILYVYVPPFV